VLASQTIDQLGNNLPLAFNRGVITTDETGTPDVYRVRPDVIEVTDEEGEVVRNAKGEPTFLPQGEYRGFFVETQHGVRASPYFSTQAQAETFKDELNIGVNNILRKQDEAETELLATEALQEARLDEQNDLLRAAAILTRPDTVIDFDDMATADAIRLNQHMNSTMRNQFESGDTVPVELLAEIGLDPDKIDALLPTPPVEADLDFWTNTAVASLASQKNIKIDDPGFERLASRRTGTKNLERMTATQLWYLSRALNEMPVLPGTGPQSLPFIKRPIFTSSQYNTAVASARNMPARPEKKLRQGEILKSDLTNALEGKKRSKPGVATESIIERALKRKDLFALERRPGAYIHKEFLNVTPWHEQYRVRPTAVPPKLAEKIAERRKAGKPPTQNQLRQLQKGIREEDIEGTTPFTRGEPVEVEARAAEAAAAEAAAAEAEAVGTISPFREKFIRGVHPEGRVFKRGVAVRPARPIRGLRTGEIVGPRKGIPIRRDDTSALDMDAAAKAFKARLARAEISNEINRRLATVGGRKAVVDALSKAIKSRLVKYRKTIPDYTKKIDGVSVSLVNTLSGKKEADIDWEGNRLLISVALDQLDTKETLKTASSKLANVINHEMVHALRDKEFISPKDWKLLTKFVKKRATGLRQTLKDDTVIEKDKTYYEAAQIIYKDEYHDRSKADRENLIVEEAIADAFRDWTEGRGATGKPASLFRRIVDFFIGLKNGLTNANIRNANQVFMGLYGEPETPAPRPVAAAEQVTPEDVERAEKYTARIRQTEADLPDAVRGRRASIARSIDTPVTPAVPRTTSEILDFIRANPEGFTLDIEGRPTPLTGYVVAPVKAAETKVKAKELNEAIVDSFIKDLVQLRAISQRPVYMGGWLSPKDNMYYLDGVQIYDNLEEALYLADVADQTAIWDLGKLNEVWTEEGIASLQEAGAYSDRRHDELRRSQGEIARRFTPGGDTREARPGFPVQTGREATGLDRETYDRRRANQKTGRESDLRYTPVETGELTGDGRGHTEFFSFVTRGTEGRPTTKQEYEPVITLSDELGFDAEYQSHLGNFDAHIATSIPGFREVQAAVGEALVKSYGADTDVLDIGASEGALIKTISSRSGGNIRTVGIDPNAAMAETFETGTPVAGAEYEISALGSAGQEGKVAWRDDDGSFVRYYQPDRKFDVVHEAMVFQFISGDREPQIQRMKEMAKDDGLVIIEEKIFDNEGEARKQWNKNEYKKDKFKRQYFTERDISKKREETLVGMHDNMISTTETENILANNFGAVAQFWDSGNFKGYAASDNSATLDKFLSNLQSLESDFSTTKTPRQLARRASIARRVEVGKPSLTIESLYGGFSTPVAPNALDPMYQTNKNLIWQDEAVPVFIPHGHNEWSDDLLKNIGLGKAHADLHLTDIKKNTPFNSVEEMLEAAMEAYWPHRNNPEVGGVTITPMPKKQNEIEKIRMEWDSPDMGYPSVFVFHRIPFSAYPGLLTRRPDLEGRHMMSLITAWNGPSNKESDAPVPMPAISPRAERTPAMEIIVQKGVNDAVAANYRGKERLTLSPSIRKRYSINRGIDKMDPEMKEAAEKVMNIGGDQSFMDKMFSMFRATDPSDHTFATKFRQKIVDRFAGFIARGIQVQKLRKEMGIEEEIALDSATSSAAGLLTRKSGITAAGITKGFLIRDRGRIYALHEGLINHSDPAVAEAYKAAYDRMVEETAYIDPVTKEEVRIESPSDLAGLVDILAEIDKEQIWAEFFLYAAAKRAQRLTEEGREKTFTDKDIEIGLRAGEMHPSIDRAYRKYQLWNNAVINIMRDSGVISDEAAALWKANADYLPFYRELYDDAGVTYEVISPEGVATRDVMYRSMKDPNNRVLSSFYSTKTPRELKGGKPVFWVMVNNVSDHKRYLSKSQPLYDRVKELRERNGPDVQIRIAADNQRIADPLNNMLRNLDAAVTSSLQNMLVLRGIRDLRELGLASEPVKSDEPPGGEVHPSLIGVRVNGDTWWYEVQDSLMLDSLMITDDVNMPALGLQAAPATLLRELVTKDPAFMAANMLRDTLSAWTTSGVGSAIVGPNVIGTLKGYGQALLNSSSAAALEASGAVGGYDFKGDPKNAITAFRKHLRMKSPHKYPGRALWEWANKLSGASDTATRVAVYERVLKETGDETAAIIEALEVINFSRKGSSAAIRYLTAVIPFLNARIQGLDVLYRGMSGRMTPRMDRATRQRRFYFRAAQVIALTIAYNMALGDEEENPWYHNAPEYIKDNYWIIPPTWFGMDVGPETPAYRIPIPFEVGVLFKVIPERIMRLIDGETDFTQTRESALRHLTTTFNVSFPQWFQPILESMTNHNWYASRPIVTYWGERNESWLADPEYVSPLALELSEVLGEKMRVRWSAEQIDHLLRGYTGTLGSYALMAADSVMRNAAGIPKRADRRLDQMPPMARFLQEQQGRGPVQAFNELYNELDIFNNTLKELSETDPDRAGKYMGSRANLAIYKKEIARVKDELDGLRKFRRQVQADRGMSGEDKKDMLMNLDELSNEIVSHLTSERSTILRRQ